MIRRASANKILREHKMPQGNETQKHPGSRLTKEEELAGLIEAWLAKGERAKAVESANQEAGRGLNGGWRGTSSQAGRSGLGFGGIK